VLLDVKRRRLVEVGDLLAGIEPLTGADADVDVDGDAARFEELRRQMRSGSTSGGESSTRRTRSSPRRSSRAGSIPDCRRNRPEIRVALTGPRSWR
jgi:hypothetical protein